MLIRISLIVIIVTMICQDESSAQWLGQKRPELGVQPDYVEPIELTDQAPKQKSALSWSRLNWHPQPIEWQTPKFVRKMNANSARFWSNTRRTVGHWAQSTNSAIRRSTQNTWEMITSVGRGSRQEPEDESRSLAPNSRAVNDFLSRPRVKF